MSVLRMAFIGGAGAALALLVAVTLTTEMEAAAAAAQPPVEQEVGGGAPTKVLIDNASMRVTLVSFPADFIREGGQQRRMEQLIVYLDPGEFEVVGGSGNPRPRTAGVGPESPITLQGTVSDSGVHPPGTVAWHPKDSLTSTLRIKRAYRALYIETKN